MARVGPYEVHEQLGRGGMGAVFRAVDPRTGQEVALKLLSATDERSRRRLVLEARALVQLRHANVVSILDAGEDRGRPWLALELVRGRSLQERLDRDGPLAPPDAARLVGAVAQALAHAHLRGVLHRDLKPANVLLPDDGGEPKLTDFGLAGFTFDMSQSRLTKSGMFMGSPGYWSPEQASGKASSIGPSTDVYGLGGLLHAALSGRPPIDGESLPQVLAATLTARPEPSGTDSALDAIALRCLEKRPEDRYPSVDAVARALRQYVLPPRGTAPTRGPGPAAWIGAAVAVLVLGGAAAWGLRRPQALSVPTPPSTPTTNAPTTTATTREATPAPPGVSDPPLTPLTSTRAEVEALLASGRSRVDRGDLQGAITDYDRAIELDPRHAGAYYDRGSARFSLSDLRGAVADHDRAIELDPRYMVAYVSRGNAKAELGDPSGAIADFDRAIELDARDATAHANRGSVKMNLGDLRGAITDLDRAIELDPRHTNAYVNRGNARANVGDPRGAITDYDRAIELDVRGAAAHYSRGTARASVGDFRGAITDYDRAIELDPRFAVAYVNRGNARANLRDLEGAITDFDRGIELDPRSANAHVNRGLAKAHRGDPRGAITDFDRGIELDPGHARAYASRGPAKAALGDHRGAIVDYEEALRLAPNASWAETVRRQLADARAQVAGQ